MRHDYSQIEYRMLAHYARGPSGKAVREQYSTDPNTDFHDMVLDMVAPVAGWDVSTKAQRTIWRKPLKNINFGLCYGMGKPLLAHQLGLTADAADTLFNNYHRAVPFVKATAEAASQTAQSKGYITTIYGRRAYFELWEPRNWSKRDDNTPALRHSAALERYGPNITRAYTHKALNALLQGSAADLLKVAMRDLHRSGVHASIGVPMLTCHDEKGHSVGHSKEQREAAVEVKRIMESALTLRVPILADQSFGANWGDAK
jgi:DNA polymerase I-like protein with 3'-5' exonuclease and polymerase domains